MQARALEVSAYELLALSSEAVNQELMHAKCCVRPHDCIPGAALVAALGIGAAPPMAAGGWGTEGPAVVAAHEAEVERPCNKTKRASTAAAQIYKSFTVDDVPVILLSSQS